MSRAKPGSEAVTSITCPSARSFMTSNTFMIGPGHWRPLQFRRMATDGCSGASACPAAPGIARTTTGKPAVGYRSCALPGRIVILVVGSKQVKPHPPRIKPDVLKAVLHQDSNCVVGPHADRAEDDVLTGSVQLPQPLSQLPQRLHAPEM
jgi:hypothetical protein